MAKLGLTRDDLAKFLPDHRAIRAFEKLFVDIDDGQTTSEESINILSLVAENASSNAVLALALIDSINQLAELVAMSPSESTQDESTIDLIHHEHISDDFIHVNQEQSNVFDYIEFNQTSLQPSANQITFNNGKLNLGGEDFSQSTIYLNVLNDSGVNFTAGQVIAIYPAGFKKYDTAVTTNPIVGVTFSAINSGQIGRIATFGEISIDTSAWSIGDKLYSDGVTAGAINNVSGTEIGMVIGLNKVFVRI